MNRKREKSKEREKEKEEEKRREKYSGNKVEERERIN